MTHRTFRSIVLTIVLTLLASVPAFSQSQSIAPSGACKVTSTAVLINGPAGLVACVPDSPGSADGTYSAVSVGTTTGITTAGYTVNFSNATLDAAATTTADVTLITLPAGATVVGVKAVLVTLFAAPSLSALTVSIGDAVSTTAYSSTLDGFVTPSATTLIVGTAPYKTTTTASNAILARFTSTGANLSALTAGRVDITLSYILNPTYTVITAGLLPQEGTLWAGKPEPFLA